jgi:hypothetical protein
VGYARRNFMVPIPRFHSWEALNTYLAEQCRKRRERRLRGHTETIAERFERDRAAMLKLPAAPYEACDKTTARVSSQSLVRYRGNDYSVPTQYGHRQVLVKGYVHQVVIYHPSDEDLSPGTPVIACGSEVIARHEPSYEREVVVFDPLHYLALLEQKTRALDQAAPLAGWQLPECFAQLRSLLEARLKRHGSREYVQVLRLLETFALEEVTQAIEDALQLGTISFDAVRHLLLCRIERRPPRLDMENYRPLPSDGETLPPLPPEAYEEGRSAAPGYDIHGLETEWREFWESSGKPQLANPAAAFVGFCRSRHKRAPIQRRSAADEDDVRPAPRRKSRTR